MAENQAQEYHKNTLKSVRAAINRHVKDIGRTVDIVRDTEFKYGNAMFGAKLKFNLRNALSCPTQYHPVISNQELMQINTYLEYGTSWQYILSIVGLNFTTSLV